MRALAGLLAVLVVSSTAAAAPGPARYVALGDSVTYGVGLANPSARSQGASLLFGGLPPDQGPAGTAYPSVVASSLGLRMALRPSGCALGGDNLAVAAAPSSRDAAGGLTDDCTANTTPRKAVDPEELAAAGLSGDPPGLVTLLVGAEDIRYSACLRSELLGLVLQRAGQAVADFLAVLDPDLVPPACVQGNAVSQTTARRLRTLHRSVDRILTTIESRTAARVLVLTYFQIIPAPGAPLQPDDVFCAALSLLTPDERTRLAAHASVVQSALNATIARAAAPHARARVVDLGDAFTGAEMCTESPAVFSWPPWRLAHPNADGQVRIARRVIDAALAP